MRLVTAAPAFDVVAPGVARLGIGFVNVYFLGERGKPWVLVDTGLPHTAALTRAAAAERFGTRPEAVVLTHGHVDHAGSALDLAGGWDVPIYAHPMERPFLTGRSDYPPQDPTMGGAIAFLARFFPHAGYDFGDRVRPLPDDGTLPGAPAWRWLHTPGHAPGHVSLFREADRTLVAGDALATMDLDSWTAQVTKPRDLSRPPAPFTPDWEAARESVQRLAQLEPTCIAAGHGLPVQGPDVPARLRRFAVTSWRPSPSTRYVPEPAHFSERGLEAVPPPAPDPLPRRLASAAFGAGVGAAVLAAWNRP